MTGKTYSRDQLRGMNPEQAKAVTTTEGKVCVVAGAGSGKTMTLTERYSLLVNEVGIAPGNIMCLTFTNKAANEMRSRIRKIIGDRDTGYICTFHGLCNQILKEDIHVIHYPKDFKILDNSDVKTILRAVYTDNQLTSQHMNYKKAMEMIRIRKSSDSCPPYYHELIDLPTDKLKEKYDAATTVEDIIYYGYLYNQKKCYGLDYQDLLYFTLYVFQTNKAVCEKWQRRAEYIMVDEYQDIDRNQNILVDILSAYHQNLYVVGDPDQTIYSWRGARVEYILNFSSRCDVEKVLMNTNYRSTPQILAVANSLISKNEMRIRKNLEPVLPDGPRVCCHQAKSKEDEADWIAERIKTLQAEDVSLSDVTLLYRTHTVSRSLEYALQKAGLPYRIHSGTPFYERTEIKTAIAYLNMVRHHDDLSFLQTCNTPKRNIGKKRLAKLKEHAEANGTTLFEALRSLSDTYDFKRTKATEYIELIDKYTEAYSAMEISDLLTALLAESRTEEMYRLDGDQERLDNLSELKQSICEYENSQGEDVDLTDYLSHIALLTSADAEETQGKVTLMTIHAAKGLQFPYVFLCGMNEGVIPSRQIRTKAGIEEERRLAFVGITRAEKGLFLTFAKGKDYEGVPMTPSRFLYDIDPGLLEFTSEEKALPGKRTVPMIGMPDGTAPESTEAVFDVGQTVNHRFFGIGTVTDVDLRTESYLVSFSSTNTPRSISFSSGLDPV